MNQTGRSTAQHSTAQHSTNLAYAPSFRPLSVAIHAILLTSLLTACGGGGGSSSSPTTETPIITDAPTQAPTQSVSGLGVDGYIAGATVFLDLNGNGLNDNEPTTTTDAQGRYTLNGISLLPGQVLLSSQLVLTGGTDTGTGQPFTGVMTAKPDANNPSTHITPLTTLVNALAGSNPTVESLANAKATLGKVLGISAGNVTADPMTMALAEPAMLQKAVAMQKAIEVLASAEAGVSGNLAEATQNAANAIAQTIAQVASVVNTSQPESLPSVSSLIQTTVNTQTSQFRNPSAVQSVAALASETANKTELVVSAAVATLLASGALTSNSSADNIANAVQESVNTSVAGLSELHNLVLASAKTVTTTPSSAPLSLAGVINQNAATLGARADTLLSLASSAQTTTVPTLTQNNINQVAQSLATVHEASQSIKVELPSVAPTSSPSLAPSVAPSVAPTPAPTTGGGGSSTPPSPTPAPTVSNSTFTATTSSSLQTATGSNIQLPAGYTNIAVSNTNPNDGVVIIQANDGVNSIQISVAVGSKDASIFGVSSYEAQMGTSVSVAQPTAVPTPAPTTPAPTSAPVGTGTYTANTSASQVATGSSIVLPSAYSNIAVLNNNTTDGVVYVQANDGNGNTIVISVAVGNKDALIYGLTSYASATGGSITNN